MFPNFGLGKNFKCQLDTMSSKMAVHWVIKHLNWTFTHIMSQTSAAAGELFDAVQDVVVQKQTVVGAITTDDA